MYQNKYYPFYIKLETEMHLQNAVTFVLVKLDTTFKAKNILRNNVSYEFT